MKVRILLFGICISALNSLNCTAQTKSNMPQSIISSQASIRTYNDDKTLKAMPKGELVELYIERMKVIVRILPKIGLATKPGVTMADLGIPDANENKKALELHREGTKEYLDSSVNFSRKMLPFCDKGQLISAILFYEQTLKSLKDIEVE